MGEASYIEDIEDRLAEDFHLATGQVRRGNVTPIRDLIAYAQKLLEQLGSEPDKTKKAMAAKIVSLQKEVRGLRAEVERLHRSNDALESGRDRFRRMKTESRRELASKGRVPKQRTHRPDVASLHARVDEVLLRLCREPRAEEKIVPKLRPQFGEQLLRERIQWLIRQGKLRVIQDNGKLRLASHDLRNP
jgi:predicted RNase H-like nuclease (RuvC/YqgF family)